MYENFIRLNYRIFASYLIIVIKKFNKYISIYINQRETSYDFEQNWKDENLIDFQSRSSHFRRECINLPLHGYKIAGCGKHTVVENKCNRATGVRRSRPVYAIIRCNRIIRDNTAFRNLDTIDGAGSEVHERAQPRDTCRQLASSRECKHVRTVESEYRHSENTSKGLE